MNNETKKCHACNSMIATNEGVQWGSYFYCENCFKDTHCNVPSYASTGTHNPSKFFKLDNEDTKEYLGVELEVNLNREYGYEFCQEHHTETIYYLLKNYKDLFTYEKDGSIGDGVEFKTYPCTYEYHKSKENDYKDFFEYLINNGYKGHDTSCCGIHVHVSRDYLGDNEEEQQKVIDKIILFIETYKENIEKFARRKSCYYSNYVKSYYDDHSISLALPNEDYLKSTKLLRELKRIQCDHSTGSHRQVLNTSNIHTIEFRMFKSTLKFETFMAIIEFIHNLVNVCKENMVSKINWNKVINYSGDYIKEYNDKFNFVNSAYLRDNTQEIESVIEKFKDNDKKELDNYNKKLQILIDNIFEVVNEKVDITNDYSTTRDILEFKGKIMASLYNLMIKPLDTSNYSMLDMIRLMSDNSNKYNDKFNELINVLKSYNLYTHLTNEFKEKIKTIIELIKENMEGTSTNEC